MLVSIEGCSFINSIQIQKLSRFNYCSKNGFELAKKILIAHPELREEQSLVHVGEMGMGLPANKNMPPGVWVVFFGTQQSHEMLKVLSYSNPSDYVLGFETSDMQKIQTLLGMKPITETRLYEDGFGLQGMQNVNLEIHKLENSYCLRISNE